MFKIKGILFHIGAIQEFSSNLTKKEFIVSRMSPGPYPNLSFEILGHDIKKLDVIPLNSIVEVTFEIHGKAYTAKDGQAKYFNVLRTTSIEIVNATPSVEEVQNTEETLK